MKNFKYFILILVSFFMMNDVVFAAPQASSKLDYTSCLAFADNFVAIKTGTGASGDYYYKSCYRANCSNGNYIKSNMVRGGGYRCNNGNGTPYIQVTGDGCKGYKGKCNTKDATYCTVVTYVDCKRSSDGSKYTDPSEITPTNPPQPTTKKTTTTKRITTKKTTTSRRVTTKYTTTRYITTTSSTTTTAPKKSSNTNLKQLIIDNTEVKFDNKKNSYTVKIPYDITSIDIKAIPEDEKTMVVVTGNTEMSNEDSKIEIKIVAEDGTEKKVTLNVKRYSGENDDCTLANIFIENYPIDFDKNDYDYSIKLPKNVYSLDIEVLPTDELNATYEIKNNEKLKNNSNIEILVVAQNGDKCTYNIKIRKNNNTWKYVVLILLLIAALITSSYFLYKYLKKSKGRYKYE